MVDDKLDSAKTEVNSRTANESLKNWDELDVDDWHKKSSVVVLPPKNQRKLMKPKINRSEVLQTLMETGLIMPPDGQRAFAESLMKELDMPVIPLSDEQHAQLERQVKSALSKLRVPLSEEIITMRGER